jgi:hypothetical protein
MSETVPDEDRWSVFSVPVQKALGPTQHLTYAHPRHGFLDNQGLAPDFPGDMMLMGEELSIDASSRQVPEACDEAIWDR